jgi:hypothetical protein
MLDAVENTLQKGYAPELVIVYECPAQIGFPRGWQFPLNYGWLSCTRRGLLSGCVAGITEVLVGEATF